MSAVSLPAASDLITGKTRGGTELMFDGLMARLPAALKDAFQIIPSRVRDLDPVRPRLLWLHDLPNDPESAKLADAEYRKAFRKIIFVSHWQMERYHEVLNVPYSEAAVLKNAIEPIPAHKKPDGPIRLIYHTTPHRGLRLLVPVFQKLCELHDDIELDVYSSFKVYGWDHYDAEFEPVFQACRDHPKIRYHGAVPNDQVRAALQQAHIFAYPSIWPETSCIAAIEALSAGCLVVCPGFAALPETTANFALMYPYTEDVNAHMNAFANVLNNAITYYKANRQALQPRLQFQKQYCDAFYSWDVRLDEWVSLMQGLLARQ
ncbi:MAG: glycosyltransferase family 4 protein [Rhodospirillaceae bacterium]|nr:glycosyltransferase family 4 protein [Rhodospirillaceae bacterium]